VTFHTFCHTYGTWTRRYAGPAAEPTRTRLGARLHVVTSEESRKADMLPVETTWTRRVQKKITKQKQPARWK